MNNNCLANVDTHKSKKGTKLQLSTYWCFMLLEMLAYYPSTTFRPTTSSSKSLMSSVALNCQGSLSSLGSI